MKKMFKAIKNILCTVITINLIFTSTQCVYADDADHSDTKFEKANVNLNDIAYNGKSVYISVGENGEIEISNDGIHIKPVKVKGITSNLTNVKWIGTQFIVIGDNGTILTSKDGRKWTKCKGVSFKAGKINSVINNRNIIVLVGNNGKIYRSTNGLNFNSVKSNTTQSLNDVIHTTTEFVAVGNKGTIVISKDGKTWSNIKSGAVNNLVDVSWNGRVYVAVGGDAILTSSDSIKWVVKHFNNKSKNINLTLTKIAWNQKEIMVAGTSFSYAYNSLTKIPDYNLPCITLALLNSTNGQDWCYHESVHTMRYPVSQYSIETTDVNIDLLDIISANGKFIVFACDDDDRDFLDPIFSGSKPMLIGCVNETSRGMGADLNTSNTDLSVDYWKPTNGDNVVSVLGETMRKALWDGKGITIIGDTILRYSDLSGKSYIRKGRPSNQHECFIIRKGIDKIDYANKVYTNDGKYWINNDGYTDKIVVDNQNMNIQTLGLVGNITIATAYTDYDWNVAAAYTENDWHTKVYYTLLYSYDGIKWYDTKLHGDYVYLSQQNNVYIARVDGVDYVYYKSTDGINWTKQQ